MSHIEDPTVKVNAPTPLLKAVGHVHLIATHTHARLVPEGGEATVTPSTILDYAREADRLGNEINECAVVLHKQAVDAYCRAVDTQHSLDAAQDVLGNRLGNQPRDGYLQNKQDLPTSTVIAALVEKMEEVWAGAEMIREALGSAEYDEDGSLIRHTPPDDSPADIEYEDIPRSWVSEDGHVLTIPDDVTVAAQVLRQYDLVVTESGRKLRGPRA